MSTEEDVLSELLKKARVSDTANVSEPIITDTEIPLSMPPEDSDNLNKIIETRDQIAQVKKNLGTIIDSIADNPSLVTQASDVWGEWPMWQKVGAGLVLTVPALLAGVAASVGSLLVLGGATGVVYSTTGMLLEDHHSCNVHIKQRLKEGILSIADILELTIVALDNIRHKLSEEIGKFKVENSKLATQVSALGDQIHTLAIEVQMLVDTEQCLRTAKETFQQQAITLKQSTEEQSALLKKNQEELEAIKEDYRKNQEMLTGKVEELRKVRESMAAEVGKTRKVSAALQKAVVTLSGQVLEDQSQKQAFQDKLKLLLDDKEASVTKVMERMSITQHDLDVAKEDLLANNARNKELLDRQEDLVRRLEQLDLSVVVAAGKEIRASVSHNTMFARSAQVVSEAGKAAILGMVN